MLGSQPVVVPVNTGLDGLLRAYGVVVNKNIVLDSSCARAPVSGAIKEIYHVPIIRKAGFDRESVITKYLKGLAMIKVSSVDVDAATARRSSSRHATLVSSSDESWQMTGQVNLNPFYMMPPENKDEMTRYGLAVLVAGKFDSYLQGTGGARAGRRRKRGRAPETITVQKLEKTVPSGTTKIIVVGSSEITRSYFLMNAKRIISSALSQSRTSRTRSSPTASSSTAWPIISWATSYIPEMSSKSLDYNPLDKIERRHKDRPEGA